MLKKTGASAIAIRRAEHVKGVSAIVLPGGESTAIGKLLSSDGLAGSIIVHIKEGKPVFGTCAGMIMIAKTVMLSEQPLLGMMDITVKRNAFGRQKESFETDLKIKGISSANKPFRAVFIRAPRIESAGNGVEILSEYGGKAVVAKQDNILVCAFHPELTSDTRMHEYFLEMI